MIPKNGYKRQINIDQLPHWLIDLREYGEEIHKSMYDTRSGLEIYKVESQFVVVSRYAPVRLEAYIVEVCDEVRAKEHERYDLYAEHTWEREQDMLADAREAEYDDREPDDFDPGW